MKHYKLVEFLSCPAPGPARI